MVVYINIYYHGVEHVLRHDGQRTNRHYHGPFLTVSTLFLKNTNTI